MIMGRLSRSTPSVRVNYRKLVDEISGSCDSLKIMPGLPDYFFYSCRQCGHRQKLQVINKHKGHTIMIQNLNVYLSIVELKNGWK